MEGSASEVSRHIAALNEFALRMLRHPWLFLLPRRVPNPFNRSQVRALRSLNKIVFGIIQARRRKPGGHDDLLAMLLFACDEETGRGMSDVQMWDEVINHFALQELLIFTVLFFRHFTFRLAAGFRVEPDPLITLRPRHGMKMTVQIRRSLESAVFLMILSCRVVIWPNEVCLSQC